MQTIELLIFLCVSLGVLYYILISLYAFIQGAPYVPTKDGEIEEIIKIFSQKRNIHALDLGSGDGRLVIALAKRGIPTDGYEINAFLVWWSRWKIRKNKLQTKARVFQKNFWNADISDYDIIIIYGIPHIMKRMEKKLQRELKKDALVISNSFKLPTWKPTMKKNRIYVYTHA